jgi:hypothetical protein
MVRVQCQLFSNLLNVVQPFLFLTIFPFLFRLISRLRAIDLENPEKGDAVTQVFPGMGNDTAGKVIDVFWPLACGSEFNHAGTAIQRAQKYQILIPSRFVYS